MFLKTKSKRMKRLRVQEIHQEVYIIWHPYKLTLTYGEFNYNRKLGHVNNTNFKKNELQRK